MRSEGQPGSSTVFFLSLIPKMKAEREIRSIPKSHSPTSPQGERAEEHKAALEFDTPGCLPLVCINLRGERARRGTGTPNIFGSEYLKKLMQPQLK